MSRINLEDLADKNPDKRDVLRKLSAWLRTHHESVIVPSIVARQLDNVDAYALASTLVFLAQRGALTRYYKVITPSGVLAEGEFDNVAAIPPKLRDRFNNYFDTADADVTPVFRREDV